MKSLFSTWMPILAHYRVPLLVATMLLVGLGFYLTMPTAPLSSEPLSFRSRAQSLSFISPHTLLWTSDRQTQLYNSRTFEVQATMRHDAPLHILWASHSSSPLVAISQDGQWFAIATSQQSSNEVSAQTGTIEIWSVTTQQRMTQIPITLISPPQLWRCVTISSDGQRVGWITSGQTIKRAAIWDQHAQAITYTYQDTDPQGLPIANLLLDSPDPLLIRADMTVIEMRQWSDMRLRYRLPTAPQEGGLWSCGLSPTGTLMVGSYAGGLTVRRVADGQLLWRLPTRQPSLLENVDTWNATAAFSADQRYLLVASSFERGIRMLFPQFPPPAYEPAVLWDLKYGQVVQRFAVQPDGALMVAYSPDGQYVATFGKRDDEADAQPGKRGEIRVFRVQPQRPFLQPLCIALGLVLLMLVVIPWLWLRR